MESGVESYAKDASQPMEAHSNLTPSLQPGRIIQPAFQPLISIITSLQVPCPVVGRSV